MKKLFLAVALCLAAVQFAPAATIGTTFASGNSFAGNMFDVTNVSGGPVTILGTFRVNVSGDGPQTMDVYYRLGGYAGFESNAGDWTLLGSDTFTPMGVGVPSPIDAGNSFVIGAGETYGMYFDLSSYVSGGSQVNYTNGSDVLTDGVLQLTLGIGRGDPAFTGSIFNPRIWNGEIDYVQGAGAVPEPATWAMMGGALLGLAALRRKRA
ncbi:MAG: PEP-CTERM sorting domain-containing protein [Bryobacteraceae bacterium]|nr:PEP-CTERM sorting domain-containing protein [Bryobacteraceae bacterium]